LKNLFRLVKTSAEEIPDDLRGGEAVAVWDKFRATGKIGWEGEGLDGEFVGGQRELAKAVLAVRPTVGEVVRLGERHVSSFLEFLQELSIHEGLGDGDEWPISIFAETDMAAFDRSLKLRRYLAGWLWHPAAEPIREHFRKDIADALPFVESHGRLPPSFVSKYGELREAYARATNTLPSMEQAVVARLKRDPRLFDDRKDQLGNLALLLAIGGDDQIMLVADRLIRSGTVDPQGSKGDGYGWVRSVANYEASGGDPPIRWAKFIDKMDEAADDHDAGRA
jgi:hypothetical protein